MNPFHKSGTITSVPIKDCQAFSPAGEATLENKTPVVVVSPTFHVFFVSDPDRRETRMWSKKAATLHSVPRNYLIIIHPALVIHPIVINFAKGPCQLSTPLTACRTIAETSPLSPHARQGKLTPHCSGDSKLQPVLHELLLLVSAVDKFSTKGICWIATRPFSFPERERKWKSWSHLLTMKMLLFSGLKRLGCVWKGSEVVVI